MANSNTDIFHERLADCIREMAERGIITWNEANTIVDDLEFIVGTTMSIEEKEITPQQLDWHLHGDLSDEAEDPDFMYERERELALQ